MTRIPARGPAGLAAILALACLAIAVTPAAAQEAGQPPQPTCGARSPGPVPGAAHPGDGVPDPAGRIAYFVIGRNDEAFGPIGSQLYAIDPDGSDHVLLLDCEGGRPHWSPDGSRLAFTIGFDDGSWHVATLAADGSDLRILTSGPGIHEIPAWSPDGSWLAYDSSPVGLDDPTFWVTLWRVDAEGANAAPLWDAATFDAEPRLSPDGTQVAFMRFLPDADWAHQIVVRDLTTGEERALTSLDAPVEHPEWWPDGGSILVNASDFAPDAGTIYRIDLGSPEPEPVVLLDPADGWSGVKPVPSPDGERIAFVCWATGARGEGICLMDADGSNVRTLIDAPDAAENHTAWGAAAP